MTTEVEIPLGGVSAAISKDLGSPQSPSKERFYKYFQQEVTAIQEHIGQLQHLGFIGGERQDAIDHCLAGIARLSNEVSDASGFVPPYDQRLYAQAIRGLTEQLSETRAKIGPKPKFSFKSSQKNGSAISLTDAAEAAAQQRLKLPQFNSNTTSSNVSAESSIATTPAHPATPSPADPDTVGELRSFSNTSTATNKAKDYSAEIERQPGSTLRKPSFSQASMVKLSGHTGMHIVLPSSASHATSSGMITKITRCVLDMSIPTTNGAPFAGLSLKEINESLIVVGRVAGAAHITDVKDSILVVASRQVRLHECKNIDIYLMCSSRPIIEDCEGVRFAPLPKCYTSIVDTTTQNQWDQVDDFKWLKSEHSPNWSILPESERLNDDTWEKVVPGGPGMVADDILKKIGIKK